MSDPENREAKEDGAKKKRSPNIKKLTKHLVYALRSKDPCFDELEQEEKDAMNLIYEKLHPFVPTGYRSHVLIYLPLVVIENGVFKYLGLPCVSICPQFKIPEQQPLLLNPSGLFDIFNGSTLSRFKTKGFAAFFKMDDVHELCKKAGLRFAGVICYLDRHSIRILGHPLKRRTEFVNNPKRRKWPVPNSTRDELQSELEQSKIATKVAEAQVRKLANAFKTDRKTKAEKDAFNDALLQLERARKEASSCRREQYYAMRNLRAKKDDKRTGSRSDDKDDAKGVS